MLGVFAPGLSETGNLEKGLGIRTLREALEAGDARLQAELLGLVDDARWDAFSRKRDAEPDTGPSSSGRIPGSPIGTPIARSKDAPDL